jgi:prepilin-type N-terminal cleavage/methylation domain-containing protein
MRLTPGKRPRGAMGTAGFTFIELIVGLAIMVMIAAMVTPALVGTLDKARRDAAIETFITFGPAIGEFVEDVTEYPGQLSHLTTQITGAQDDLCGDNYGTSGGGNSEVNRWDGPYLTRIIPTTGLPVSIGRARNQLVRFPNTANPSLIGLVVDSVSLEDATAIQEDYEGDNDPNANTIQWTVLSVPNGLVTLFFYVPIQDLC